MYHLTFHEHLKICVLVLLVDHIYLILEIFIIAKEESIFIFLNLKQLNYDFSLMI